MRTREKAVKRSNIHVLGPNPMRQDSNYVIICLISRLLLNHATKFWGLKSLGMRPVNEDAQGILSHQCHKSSTSLTESHFRPSHHPIYRIL